jgi:hypothetical protein
MILSRREALVGSGPFVFGANIGNGVMKHNSLVIYKRRIRNLFQKTYWIVCWTCPVRLGPFLDERVAKNISSTMDGEFGDGQEVCGSFFNCDRLFEIKK